MNKEIRGIVRKVSLIRHQANEFMRNELDNAGFNDVETAHGTIFEILLTSPPPITMKTFVEKTGRAKSTITGVIDTLEARDYVERKAIPGDRRQVGVAATEKSRILESRFGSMSDRLLDTIYRDFSSEERVDLCNLLNRALDNLKNANSERATNPPVSDSHPHSDS